MQLQCINESISVLKSKVEQLNQMVMNLTPKRYLPPIRSPIQGVDHSRNYSVAVLLEKEVENQKKSRTGERYIEFEKDVTLGTLNTNGLHVVEYELLTSIPEMYGKVTWVQACRRVEASCEHIVREALQNRYMAVFSQGAAERPTRGPLKQKMN